MTGNLVANISRRTLLLASCSLAGVPERSYAQARAMIHIILLGDSVFDNAAYVSRDPDLLRQLEQMLPQGRKATLLARDGAVISERPYPPGVEMARKGSVPQDRVLNCLELPAFIQYLAERPRKAKCTARRR